MIHVRVATAAIAICVGVLSPARAQTIEAAADRKAPPAAFADPDRLEKLKTGFGEVDRLITTFTRDRHVPGAAWGIVVDGALVHSGVAGLRDVPGKARVDAQSVFRIASMTKSFTAIAILQLRDAGKLSLDDPAERYVPELTSLEYPTTDSPRITIRHLLTHSEGFPEDNPWGDRQLAITDAKLSAMLRDGIPFSTTPGTAFEYSNYGFAILGRIVANVSGVPYAEYIATHILRPLGMHATTLEPRDVPPSHLAHGYRWEDEAWKEEPLLDHGAFGSMGGMLTTVGDLARYVALFLSAWPPRDGAEAAPLSRASLREMQQLWRAGSAFVTRDASGAVQLAAGGYGYGLGVTQTCAFRTQVAHSGGLPGYGSQMRWLPEYGVGIIAFGNLTYTGWGGVLNDAFNALAATGGLQPRIPRPSPALARARDAVSQLVNRWDDALAMRIAADNLFLDRSLARRRAEVDGIRARVGTCRPDGPFDVENAMRGTWDMTCERGRVRLAITLAPTTPPLVQYLSVRELDPANPPEVRRACPQ